MKLYEVQYRVKVGEKSRAEAKRVMAESFDEALEKTRTVADGEPEREVFSLIENGTGDDIIM